MTYQAFNQIVASFGIPYAYRLFTKETAKPAPFCVFYFDGIDDLYADNLNYQRIAGVVIELYTNQKDFELETQIENILTENKIAYSKSEVYIESEKLYEIIYESEVVIHG